MTHRILILALFLCTHCYASIEIALPEGWTPQEIPENRLTTIKSFIKVTSPDSTKEVAIGEVEIVMTLDEAVESHIRGMSKGNFQHHKTTNTMIHGYEARHIVGHFPLDNGDKIIPSESYLILTEDSMISIGVSGTEAESLIKDVLEWITFANTTTKIEERKTADPEPRSIWEYMGMLLVATAVCYIIFNAIRTSKQQK